MVPNSKKTREKTTHLFWCRHNDQIAKVSFYHRVDLLPYNLYAEPSRPILLTLEKFRHIFLKIKGSPVRIMPRHKPEVITLLSIATEPVKLLSKMF